MREAVVEQCCSQLRTMGRLWQFLAAPIATEQCRLSGWTGRHLLNARFSHFDPHRTSSGHALLAGHCSAEPRSDAKVASCDGAPGCDADRCWLYDVSRSSTNRSPHVFDAHHRIDVRRDHLRWLGKAELGFGFDPPKRDTDMAAKRIWESFCCADTEFLSRYS
jgi:hypothetical protein